MDGSGQRITHDRFVSQHVGTVQSTTAAADMLRDRMPDIARIEFIGSFLGQSRERARQVGHTHDIARAEQAPLRIMDRPVPVGCPAEQRLSGEFQVGVTGGGQREPSRDCIHAGRQQRIPGGPSEASACFPDCSDTARNTD